ncbi:MAG: peptide ABC transporter substrate-binding protein [Alphaproteobacteria bacterium]|nr:MAG: peptide ABC transporter substrate-binding protein [Alphaproteobacteria bacterium]
MTAFIRSGAGLLALILTLIGLSLPAMGEGRTALHRGNVAEPDTLDPHKLTTLYEGYISRDIYTPLVARDNKGIMGPGIAESWDISEDGLVYTFHLRDNLKWSDGHDLTADDVVAGFQRLLNPTTASQSASLVYMIKNAEEVATGHMPVDQLAIRALDPQTVEITLNHPAPQFLGIIAGGRGAPLPRHAYAEHGDEWVYQQNFVGNGAFLLAEWQPNNYIRAVKNPYFYDADKVKLEEVYYYPTEDYNAAIKRYRAGELDWNAQIPTQQMALLEKVAPDDIYISKALSITYIWVNNQAKPFDDPRVRAALAMSIDRKIITDKIMKMGETPAYSMVPPFVTDYSGPQFDFKDMSMDERRTRARELLSDAGFGPDNPLEFEYRIRATADGKRHAAAIQNFWKGVGIKANILATDIKTHYADLSEHNFSVADAGWSALDDPEDFLYLALTSSGAQNSGNYSNPDYDRLMAEAQQIADIKARFAKMAEAEAILLGEYGIIPLYYATDRHLVAPHVKGFYGNVVDVHPSQYIWIEE